MFIPQDLVRDFHVAADHPHPKEPTLEHFRAKLRAKLIVEEALEFARAAGFDVETGPDFEDGFRVIEIGAPNWPEMIDALCDVAYVTFGAAVEMGIDLSPFFREVHRNNMTKATGARRADGKTLKPDGWKPPAIRDILDKMIARAKRRRDAVKGNR